MIVNELDAYDAFANKMAEKLPRYFGEGKRYGGFAIGEGWYHIIEELMLEIDHYTKWRRNMRADDLKKIRAKNKDITLTPKVEWIQIEQIKEKFGGLRFYYQGGDDEISGMVIMAERWANNTCETCGNKGERRSGGWIRTLCDFHENLHQKRQDNNE